MRNGLRGEASETNCHQSRSRSSESSVGRAIQASHGPGLNSAKHPLISVYKVGKVFIAAIAFDRGFSIIGDFLLPLQLLRELIKFSFYFLCQGVTSKDDDDDCRTCSQNQFSVLRIIPKNLNIFLCYCVNSETMLIEICHGNFRGWGLFCKSHIKERKK